MLPVVAAALPNVGHITWRVVAPPRRLFDLQRAIRSSAATSFLVTSNLSFTQLTTLIITWEDTDPFNHQFDPGNFLDPSSPTDKFSISIHHLSLLPYLKHLALKDTSSSPKKYSPSTQPPVPTTHSHPSKPSTSNTHTPPPTDNGTSQAPPPTPSKQTSVSRTTQTRNSPPLTQQTQIHPTGRLNSHGTERMGCVPVANTVACRMQILMCHC